MKKVISLSLGIVLFTSFLMPTVDAATLASVTATRDGQYHRVNLTGNGKYMEFTCSHNKPATSSLELGATCALIKTSPNSPPVVSFFVSDPTQKSTNVFLDKGVSYQIETFVYPYSLTGTTVTGKITDI